MSNKYLYIYIYQPTQTHNETRIILSKTIISGKRIPFDDELTCANIEGNDGLLLNKDWRFDDKLLLVSDPLVFMMNIGLDVLIPKQKR